MGIFEKIFGTGKSKSVSKSDEAIRERLRKLSQLTIKPPVVPPEHREELEKRREALWKSLGKKK